MSKRYLSKVNAIVRLVVLAIGLTLVSQPICSFASGGTGGGGGGTGGGGGGTTANPNAITSFKVLAGYPPGFLTATAIWTSFSVKTANNAPPYVRLIIINTTTGETVWDYVYQSAGATIDDDYLPFNATYKVQIDLRDGSGNVLDSQSTLITTPAPKDSTTGG